MADNTDGIPITMTNALHEGLRRVAADLSGTYVLGYYTSNTNWNGRMRRITVKLKPNGPTVRARREYRAPTEAEMETLRNPPPAFAPSVVDTAFAGLASMRPGAGLHVYGRALDGLGEVVVEIAASRMEAGRWKHGGDVRVMVMAADGDLAATAGATFAPGTRGTLARMPLQGAGPWHAIVRVRGEALLHETGCCGRLGSVVPVGAK
jgi:hypothetical protein